MSQPINSQQLAMIGSQSGSGFAPDASQEEFISEEYFSKFPALNELFDFMRNKDHPRQWNARCKVCLNDYIQHQAKADRLVRHAERCAGSPADTVSELSERYWCQVKGSRVGQRRVKEVDEKVTAFICNNSLPISTLRSESFKTLLKALNANYKPLSVFRFVHESLPEREKYQRNRLKTYMGG